MSHADRLDGPVSRNLASASQAAPRLVSVIVPCHDQADFLAESLGSLAWQTHAPLEAIVVDDGSREDVAGAVERLRKAYPLLDVRLVRQENGGLPGARNAGIAQAKGEYILPLDSDDLLDPRAVAAMVVALEAHPEADIACCDSAVFGEVHRMDLSDVLGPGILTRQTLPYCGLFRRTVWEKVGGYRENMRHGYEDWDFWVACHEAGLRSLRVPEPLFRHRIGKAFPVKADDLELKARMVANHRGVFARERRLEACQQLAELAGKAAQEGVSSLALERMELALQAVPEDAAEKAALRELVAKLDRSEASKVLPDSVRHRLDEVDRLHGEGDRAQAIALMRECAEEAPRSLEILNGLAWLLVQDGDLAGAQVEYLKATRLWPDDATVHANLAGLLLRSGQAGRARPVLERVLELDPVQQEAAELLARIAREGVEVDAHPEAISFCLITNGKRPEKLAREIASIRALGLERARILIAGILPEGFHDEEIEFIPCPAAAGSGRLGSMRNRLVEHADTAVVVVVDDDMVFDPGFGTALKAMAGNFEVVCSRLLNPDGSRYWDWAVYRGDGLANHYLLDYDRVEPDVYVTGGLCVARRDVLLKVRWHEGRGFYQGEDVEFSARLHEAGVVITCNPALCVMHDDPRHSQFGAEPLRLDHAVGYARSFYASGDLGNARAYLKQVHERLPGSGFDPSMARETALRCGDAEFAATLDAPVAVASIARKDGRPTVGFDLRTLSDAQSHGRGIGHFALHHLEALARLEDAPRLVAVIPGERPEPQWAGRFEGLPVEWMPAAQYQAGSFDLLHTPDPMGMQEGYASPLQFFQEPRMSVLFHDLIPLRFYREAMGVNWPAYLNRLDLLKASRAHFLCNSEYTRSEVLATLGIDPSRVRAVGAGLNRPAASEAPCDAAALRARLGIRGDYCLYVGAMDPHKNFEGTLQAVLSANSTRSVQLVVTGRPNGAGQFWMDKLAKAGIGDRVVFTGFLERPELEALYGDAVALVFLSRLEGFGFPALEAMASGCPVVCSNAASLPEVVGEAALLHEPEDVDGATASILKLCTDSSLRAERVRRGLERATLFTWERAARRTLDAWNEILALPAAELTKAPSASKVGWISPVFDPSGYASEARAFLLGLEDAGLAPAVKAAGRHSETFAKHLPQAQREILSLQIDRTWDVERTVVFDLPAAGFGRISSKPHVGRTTFETDGLPAQWVEKCNAMDEIWVPSQFNLETFRAAGVRVPLLRIPEGVETDRFRPGLEPLPLPGERRGTTFLSVFEWTHRKGWDILLRAWADAFKPTDDVELVLRAYPANAVEGDPTAWVEERIRQFLSSIGSSRERCAPIVVLGAQIPEADMPRLYAAADIYLAPSRGEGWGRPHMEAMSSGLAVIATRWSGNLDFMDDTNSWLIEVETLEEIDAREEFGFYRGQKWACPSADHMAGLLRRAAASTDGRKALGGKARKDMVENWDWARIAPLAAVRLDEIARGIPVASSKVPELAPAARCVAVTDSVEARRHDVRWCGPLLNHSGHARQSREAILGLVQTGVRVSVDPLFSEASFVEALADDEAMAKRWDRILQAPPRKGVLVSCDLPSDATGKSDVLLKAVERSPGNRALAAWCTFETDRLPAGWAEKLARADEVWVPSTFNRETFVRAGVPALSVHVVPEGIDPARYRHVTPRILPEAAGFTFLSVFQWSRRKGWDVLLEAWAKAFGPEDDVQLVLRCSPFAAGLPTIEEQAGAFLASKGLSWETMAPVILLAEPIPEQEMPGLYAASECFVLPTRGEGWGLPYLEAMASGKPCIATAWGGQCDFLHEGVAWMLPPGELVAPDAQALAENPFLGPDHRWADPSVGDLITALRMAFEHRDLGRTKGEQAACEVRERWTPRHTAHAILERMAVLDPHGEESEAILAPLHPASIPAHSTLERTMTDDPLHVRWEGSQFVHHSLAHINREVCLELALRGHDMALQPWEQDEFRPAPGERLEPLSQLVQAPLEAPAQVHVRHQWPPQLQAPSEGRWVAIQPWEFGPVPNAWVSAWKEDLDELWVPSQFVKDGYVQSGMPAQRVAVIPNGVDADRFCPSAKPFEIPSPRGFRFLFVGGTIYRKGIDLLLTAYARAFRNTDDVSLVVKDMGGKTFYRGQTADDLFERFGSQPGNPELIVIDEPLSDAELPGLYTACHCLAHPYRGEGFGMPILEAMSAGLPVIVTEGGPAVEFCSPESAWFVPAVRKDLPSRSIGDMECAAQPWLLEPDVDALARLLREAYENRDLCRAKGARGREIALSAFTWKHMADRVEARLRAVSSLPQRRSDRPEPARNPLDPSQRNSAPSGEDEELNLLLVQIEPALMRGDAQEAKSLVNEAVERFPDHPLSWLTRAMLQRGSGKPGQGLADAERSIQCRETPEGLQEAIECCLALHRQADAERLLKRLEREWTVWCGQAKVNPAREWIGGKVRRGSKAPKAPVKKKARG